jgi:hypothetical protein
LADKELTMENFVKKLVKGIGSSMLMLGMLVTPAAYSEGMEEGREREREMYSREPGAGEEMREERHGFFSEGFGNQEEGEREGEQRAFSRGFGGEGEREGERGMFSGGYGAEGEQEGER